MKQLFNMRPTPTHTFLKLIIFISSSYQHEFNQENNQQISVRRKPRQLGSLFGSLFGHGHGHSSDEEVIPERR